MVGETKGKNIRIFSRTSIDQFRLSLFKKKEENSVYHPIVYDEVKLTKFPAKASACWFSTRLVHFKDILLSI